MNFWNSLGGMVMVELTSADPVGALQESAQKGIILSHVERLSDLSLHCEIKRRDWRRLQHMAKKRGDTLKICQRQGFYWSFRRLYRRMVLLSGFAVLLILVLYLPTRVLFVQVEGNEMLPDARIIEAAEQSGIRFWASRREVRSERVKNALLGSLPELGWAGVNTKGCVAVISVRERISTEADTKKWEVCSIVAAKDGIVESCTALEGNLLCRVGQAVKEGEVLISGYTDLGICIRACRADGEIFARTRQKMDVITLSQCQVQGDVTAVKHQYSLLIGKKRINLWKDSGIWQGSCDRMYEEYYITLPGGFSFPVAFVRESLLYRETEENAPDAALLRDSMTDAARRYLTEHMVAGRILNGTETFRQGTDTCRMEGIYLCSEMIGRVQTEKIGE